MKKLLGFAFLIAIAIISCQKNEINTRKQVLVTERLGVDYNDDYPEFMFGRFKFIDNEVADLGRVLFYDESLSINERISCSSCHVQSLAFADGKKNSDGFAMAVTDRNSMHITNIENSSPLFWDGRRSNLWDQVADPITNHIEMGYGSLEQMLDRISQKDYYPELFQAAYGTTNINEFGVRSAIAEFLMSIRSYRNTLDIAMANSPTVSSPWGNSVPDGAIRLPNEQEQRGFELFGDLGCASCHGGLDIGGRITANIGLEMEYADQGVATWSNNANEVGEFRIPTLRNVALTAPYMHDGRFATLEEVVEHYNSGIKPHQNLNWQLREVSNIETFSDLVELNVDPVDIILGDVEFEGSLLQPIRMNLTQGQKQDLIAFLRALTDKELIRDPRYSNPFVYVE